MLAWRLTSFKIYSGNTIFTSNETQFTINPALFCKMIRKFLSEYEDSKEAIYNWDELLNFGVNDLTTKFNYEGKEEIFNINYHDDEPIWVYQIETVEILVGEENDDKILV